jgi:RND family efflux transporter MFP subunit
LPALIGKKLPENYKPNTEKITTMNTSRIWLSVIALALFMTACTNSDKKAETPVEQNEMLVSVDTLSVGTFSHFIDLQAKVEAEDMAYVAPSGMGGLIKAIYVKTGQRVSKGQTLLKLDDAVARQQLSAAQQQTGMLKARLEQAKTIYQRYQNLWAQNIGAEISVINAKADVDALTAQLNAAQAQVAMAQEQVNMSNVKAEISGVVDELNVKVGELYTAQTAATPGLGIRIVNNSSLKIVTAIPENYVARVKKGSAVEVLIPESGKPSFTTKLEVVGESINASTRSFNAEAKIPTDPLYKANQTANIKILDYKADSAISIPLNTVQRDETGRYTYVAETNNGKLLARKRVVETGEAYGGQIEIKSGLRSGDVLITRGFQNVYDGQIIKAVK